MKWRAASVVLLAAAAAPAWAQGTLEDAADRARDAWLAQDASGLVESGDAIVLRLPGRREVSGVGPGQAARLLADYLRPAVERRFDLRSVRATGADRGYAEASRGYVIRGTSDELTEAVFLGFRRMAGRWRLSEIRVTP